VTQQIEQKANKFSQKKQVITLLLMLLLLLYKERKFYWPIKFHYTFCTMMIQRSYTNSKRRYLHLGKFLKYLPFCSILKNAASKIEKNFKKENFLSSHDFDFAK